jgi:hypothetical protein
VGRGDGDAKTIRAPAQFQTASELPWYRQWLLEHGYTEDDLIPFAIA